MDNKFIEFCNNQSINIEEIDKDIEIKIRETLLFKQFELSYTLRELGSVLSEEFCKINKKLFKK